MLTKREGLAIVGAAAPASGMGPIGRAGHSRTSLPRGAVVTIGAGTGEVDGDEGLAASPARDHENTRFG
jgi:hypothetical protein